MGRNDRFLARMMQRDVVTGSNITVDTNHAQVHEGNAYSFYVKAAIAPGETLFVGMQTAPKNYLHVQRIGLSLLAAVGTLYLVEEPVYTGGTAVPVHNHNRVRPMKESSTVIVLNPTVTEAGNNLMCITLDGGKQGQITTGSVGSIADEYVFSPNMKYGWRLLNDNGSTLNAVVNMFWYDEGAG